MPWNRSTTRKPDGSVVIHKDENKLPEREIRAQKFASDLYRICRLLQLKRHVIVDETSLGWGAVEAKMSDDLKQTFDEIDVVLKRIEE